MNIIFSSVSGSTCFCKDPDSILNDNMDSLVISFKVSDPDHYFMDPHPRANIQGSGLKIRFKFQNFKYLALEPDPYTLVILTGSVF